jgi:hypothetical protein
MIREGLPFTGHDDHAHIGMLAQVAREGEPVLARQAEIENDEVHGLPGQLAAQPLSVPEGADTIPLLRQVGSYQFPDVRFIVDDQDVRRNAHHRSHGLHPLPVFNGSGSVGWSYTRLPTVTQWRRRDIKRLHPSVSLFFQERTAGTSASPVSRGKARRSRACNAEALCRNARSL